MDWLACARRIQERLTALGKISDDATVLLRTFRSPAMGQANRMVAGWMSEAGMQTHEDVMGNLVGHAQGTSATEQVLLLGSHLDTVPNAGRYDGPLGVVLAVEAMDILRQRGKVLPFHVDILGFSDEEGVRFQSTYLGSKGIAGTLSLADLARSDSDGVTVGHASGVTAPPPPAYLSKEVLGYLEVHIEQGPVLEDNDLPVGVVTSIASQSRLSVIFAGKAAHAGTTPMNLRHDALAGAAEWITRVETIARSLTGLVATVGKLEVLPGAGNVIPSLVTASLDVRHEQDAVREKALADLETTAREIASRRNLGMSLEIIQSTAAVPCSIDLSARLSTAAAPHVREVIRLASGAGHDAVAISTLAPIALLFVRCTGGISHHPDEAVKDEDIATALAITVDFLEGMTE